MPHWDDFHVYNYTLYLSKDHGQWNERFCSIKIRLCKYLMLSFPFELVPVNVSTDELASFVRISLAVTVSMQKVISLTKSWKYILLKAIFKGEIK